MACEYDRSGAVEGEGSLILDRPEDSERLMTLCLVMGKANTPDPLEERIHCLLVATAVGETMYERVVRWMDWYGR
jgi:hypothetical protein